MESETITVRFSRAEALVLFDLLARLDESNPIPVAHPAERTMLWVLEGQLEKQLREILSPSYKDVLEVARQEVVNTR